MTLCASCGHPPHVGRCPAQSIEHTIQCEAAGSVQCTCHPLRTPCECGVCVMDGPTAPLERRIERLESEVREMREAQVRLNAQILALEIRVTQLGAFLAKSTLRLQ